MLHMKHPFSGFFRSSNMETILDDEVPQHWQSHIFSIALKLGGGETNKTKPKPNQNQPTNQPTEQTPWKISWVSIAEEVWFWCEKG